MTAAKIEKVAPDQSDRLNDGEGPAPAENTDYGPVLEEIHQTVKPFIGKGKVASYIPELASVPAQQFGMSIHTVRGETWSVGDAKTLFSIQSISKVFSLVLALQAEGEAMWKRVGREPSGNAFNSLVQLERESGIPRNPFINAGALVVTDILCSRYSQPEDAVLELLQRLAGNPSIGVNSKVVDSERQHADRNAAMGHFMKSFGNLHHTVDQVLDSYCRQCAVEMSCADLARAISFLAHDGMNPHHDECILSPQLAKRVNALMLTCGTYDSSGDFAYHVGLPAKSGVGGGIVAVMPDECGICVWSPSLDPSGNSHAGSMALELLTALTGRSIF